MDFIKSNKKEDLFKELNDNYINDAKNSIIAEFYTRAKIDGSNPELVKAVEDLLGNVQQKEAFSVNEQPQNIEQPSETQKKEITDLKVYNSEVEKIKSQLGDRAFKKYYEQLNRLVNINQENVVQLRKNGIVLKEGDKYVFKAFADTDLKNWRLIKLKGNASDVTNQFIDNNITQPSETQNAPLVSESNTQQQEQKVETPKVELQPNQTQIADNVIATIDNITLPDGENGFKITVSDLLGNLIEDKNGDSEFEFNTQDEVDKFVSQKEKGYKLSKNRPTVEKATQVSPSTQYEGAVTYTQPYRDWETDRKSVV